VLVLSIFLTSACANTRTYNPQSIVNRQVTYKTLFPVPCSLSQTKIVILKANNYNLIETEISPQVTDRAIFFMDAIPRSATIHMSRSFLNRYKNSIHKSFVGIGKNLGQD
jgi:hypothetical protein